MKYIKGAQQSLKLKDRSSYYESLEAKILSLKEDLEELNK